jgi:hypothetical protein
LIEKSETSVEHANTRDHPKKTATFAAAPTYIGHSDVDYSTDEEDPEEFFQTRSTDSSGAAGICRRSGLPDGNGRAAKARMQNELAVSEPPEEKEEPKAEELK